MQNYDVAIIGGGAAGLACAVRLKQLNGNLSVVILEAADRLGKKIAATGNGQGNISNADMSARHYHGSFAPLAAKLCCGGDYNPLSLFDFLCSTDKNGRIYPAGKQASAVADSLIRQVKEARVTCFLSTKVTSLSRELVITTSEGKKISAKRVVLCAGGCAQKQFNTDGGAFKLARSLGHSVTPVYPSLVQLKCAEDLKTLKGIRAECRVSVYHGSDLLAKSSGDVIFTDYGVSGNAIFYASAYCAGMENIRLSLEFLPDVNEEDIVRCISERQKRGYPTLELLGGTLHNQIGRAVIKRAGDDPQAIARMVKNFPLTVVGSLGWDYAQVTKGGIPYSEVGDDLQSKLVKGLYFGGEVLDSDGDCGGYNLHFAFVCGMHAAENIFNSLKTND